MTKHKYHELNLLPKISELSNSLNRYLLWDNKPDKVNRKTIIQDYENSGLRGSPIK